MRHVRRQLHRSKKYSRSRFKLLSLQPTQTCPIRSATPTINLLNLFYCRHYIGMSNTISPIYLYHQLKYSTESLSTLKTETILDFRFLDMDSISSVKIIVCFLISNSRRSVRSAINFEEFSKCEFCRCGQLNYSN